MNITEMLGNPVGDVADVYFPEERTCSVPAPMPPQQAANRRSHGIWIALGLIIAGTVGLATGFYLSARSVAGSPSPTQPTARSVAVPTSVDSFAEFATALHLTGMATADELASMYATAPAAIGSTGLWVNHTTTISTTPLGGGLFAATIAADVLELVDGAYESAGIQYFEVTVAADRAQPIVVSGPARVPAPAPTPETDRTRSSNLGGSRGRGRRGGW